MRIVVVGRGGQLGSALRDLSLSVEHEFVFFGRKECDLSQHPKIIENFIHGLSDVDVVIIAAAYTNVDAAESEMELAYKVNADAPGAIANACYKKNIKLIFVSTDYVFDGRSRTPIPPDHPTHPINFYGKTKRDGEIAILKSNVEAVILRTSWVFDGIGKNFLTTMIRLGRQLEEIKVVNDQIGRPTYAGVLAEACLRAAEGICTNPLLCGIYHVSGSGNPINWAEFAKAIFSKYNETNDKHKSMAGPSIKYISSSDFPTQAERPKYSVLDITKFEKTFDMQIPVWEDGLAKAIAEIQERK